MLFHLCAGTRMIISLLAELSNTMQYNSISSINTERELPFQQPEQRQQFPVDSRNLEMGKSYRDLYIRLVLSVQ